MSVGCCLPCFKASRSVSRTTCWTSCDGPQASASFRCSLILRTQAGLAPQIERQHPSVPSWTGEAQGPLQVRELHLLSVLAASLYGFWHRFSGGAGAAARRRGFRRVSSGVCRCGDAGHRLKPGWVGLPVLVCCLTRPSSAALTVAQPRPMKPTGQQCFGFAHCRPVP